MLESHISVEFSGAHNYAGSPRRVGTLQSKRSTIPLPKIVPTGVVLGWRLRIPLLEVVGPARSLLDDREACFYDHNCPSPWIWGSSPHLDPYTIMSDTETKTQTTSEGDIKQLSSFPEPCEIENGSPPPERVEGPVPEVRCLIASVTITQLTRPSSASSPFRPSSTSAFACRLTGKFSQPRSSSRY